MRCVYYIATIYLGALGITALFLEFNKWHWFWKLTAGFLASMAVILSLAYQHIEKKADERDKQISDFRSEQRTQVINQKLDALNEKEKRGLFTDKDFLSRIGLELEKLNINIKSQENLIRPQYLTAYFNEAAKIPDFYTWEEWKETEAVLYQRILSSINGNFNARGVYNSGMRVALIDEFNKEREKYIKAKERQFKK